MEPAGLGCLDVGGVLDHQHCSRSLVAVVVDHRDATRSRHRARHAGRRRSPGRRPTSARSPVRRLVTRCRQPCRDRVCRLDRGEGSTERVGGDENAHAPMFAIASAPAGARAPRVSTARCKHSTTLPTTLVPRRRRRAQGESLTVTQRTASSTARPVLDSGRHCAALVAVCMSPAGSSPATACPRASRWPVSTSAACRRTRPATKLDDELAERTTAADRGRVRRPRATRSIRPTSGLHSTPRRPSPRPVAAARGTRSGCSTSCSATPVTSLRCMSSTRTRSTPPSLTLADQIDGEPGGGHPSRFDAQRATEGHRAGRRRRGRPRATSRRDPRELPRLRRTRSGRRRRAPAHARRRGLPGGTDRGRRTRGVRRRSR